jgi:predicted nucleic acid-binding protein
MIIIFKLKQGLRTLDAIQLASAIEVKEVVDKYFTSDKLLISLFEKENLPTS